MVIQGDSMGFNGIYDGIASGQHSQFANWKMAQSKQLARNPQTPALQKSLGPAEAIKGYPAWWNVKIAIENGYL